MSLEKLSPRSKFFLGLLISFFIFSGLYVLVSGFWYTKLVLQHRYLPQSIRSGFVRHPYLTSDHIPHQSITEVLDSSEGPLTYVWNLNSNGCRDDFEYPLTKPPGVTRWICLGGSALVSGSKNQTTIPAFLRKQFQEISPSLSSSIEILNFARVGWTSTQEMFFLATTLQNYEPDYLLIYDGRNDAFHGCLPEYRPYWNAWNFETDRELNQRSFLKEVLPPIWKIHENWKRFFYPEEAARQQAHHLFQDLSKGQRDFYRIHPECILDYERNLRNMISLAREMKCKGVLLILQPQLYWSGKKLHASEIAYDQNVQPSWRKAMVDIYSPMAQAHQRLRGTQHEVATFDLNPIFLKDSGPIFRDDCHLTDEGNLTVAKELLPLTVQLMNRTAAQP